jgi:Mn2+/Fe2+ NRAMP family transporter
MMRLDLIVGYVLTALFMVAMLVVGAELLFASGEGISGEEGLVALADPIQERFGVIARWLFLIGFWAAATSSIVGAWNGSAYLFADSVRTSRDVPDERAEEYLSEKSIYFRAMLVWISFPPMLLLFFGEPVLLIIVYAAMGALFLPFLAITLLWLLNSSRVAPEHRNGIVANAIFVLSVLLFAFLGVQEVLGSL